MPGHTPTFRLGRRQRRGTARTRRTRLESLEERRLLTDDLTADFVSMFRGVSFDMKSFASDKTWDEGLLALLLDAK